MKKTFSIKQLFQNSIEDYKKYWGMFILVGIIFLLLAFLAQVGVAPQAGYAGGMRSGSFLIMAAVWLLQGFITLGFIRMLLAVVDKKEAKIEQLFHGASSFYHFLYFIVAMLLYAAVLGLGFIIGSVPFVLIGTLLSANLAFVLGLMLSIAVSLFLAISFIFVQYLVAEEREGIFESFKKSFAMAEGVRLKILLLMFVTVLFNFAGLVALGIGLVITIPVTYLVYAHLYRTLLGETSNTDEEVDSVTIEETIVIETEIETEPELDSKK